MHASAHVGVVVAVQFLPSSVSRGNRLLRLQRQVQRCHALLAVEEEERRFYLSVEFDAFDRSRQELDLGVSCLQRHHRTNRIVQRDRCEQAGDVLVVPDPTSLEIGQLESPRIGPVEHLVERIGGAVESFVHAFECPPNAANAS